MIEFNLIGQWAGVADALDMLPAEIQSSAVWGQRKVAERLIRIVKGHINDQDLGWEPLDPKTNSGDPRILVDYEDYYSAIKAWKDLGTYYAGVPRTAKNRRGISIAFYAQLHEYGTSRMPARPLWEPSFQEMGGNAGVNAIVATAIYNKIKKLRSKGFTTTYNGRYIK